jgi:hypothetical protein
LKTHTLNQGQNKKKKQEKKETRKNLGEINQFNSKIMTFKKEFLPPKKLIKQWETEYWESGKDSGRFPCSYQEYILMKSAEWGALQSASSLLKSSETNASAKERQVSVISENRKQISIFDFLGHGA